MTIPAGDNWCPDCEEICHDHTTICTVCGATLVTPPSTRTSRSTTTTTRTNNNDNNNMFRVVPEHVTDDIQNASRQIRDLLNNVQTRIRNVDQEQNQLLQQILRNQQDWQQEMIPPELLNPQNVITTTSRPTSENVLNSIPRIKLQSDSSIFKQCTMQLIQKNNNNNTVLTTISPIPAEFGRPVDSQSIHINNQHSIITYSNNNNNNNKPFFYFTMRGDGITFAQKAITAETLNASVCIIGNHISEPWPYIMKDSKKEAINTTIPVIMISKQDSILLKQYINNNNEDNNIMATLTIHRDDDRTCCVCTDIFHIGNTIMKLPQCNHIFHEQCAMTWLTKHNTCPYCRNELPLQDTELERERQSNMNRNNNEAAAEFYG